MRDDDFKPKLGKIRSRGGKRGRRYLHQAVRSLALAGGSGRGLSLRRRAFTGSRIGRGAGVARVLRSRDRYRGLRARRVVIKTRIVRVAGRGQNAARMHLRYIQRDGVTREGLPGELYGATEEQADGKAFLARCTEDRHQFRMIVAVEDAVQYRDLREFTRRLMRHVEADLGTKLEWVAVDHHNTGHPHTHIVLRGKDDRGQDLVIAREYITHGMRERATELATLDLGPRTDFEIETRLKQEIDPDRFTSLDRGLIREAGAEAIIDLRGRPIGADARFRRTLHAGRLQRLRQLGLAAEEAPSLWRLSPELEPALRALGDRDDIIKTMHRAMSRTGQVRDAEAYAIYDPRDESAPRVVGRLVERGLSNELHDRHYVLLDGIDGRPHYVAVGNGEAVEAIPDGAVVAVAPNRAEPRDADRTIAAVARANEGRYSEELHLLNDPTSSAAFVQTHVRRLEALRRAGQIERELDGTWRIPEDFLERALRYERAQVAARPVVIETLSALDLDRQMRADGATWLDRQLVSGTPETMGDAGFGREVNAAMARRRQWLIEQGLAEPSDDQVIYRRNLLALLRRRELNRVAAQVASDLGVPYAEAREGQRIEGTYRRRVDLASGRFALIENSREFTLVPWREVLDRHVGKPVGGIMRGETISWTIGRQRGRSIS